jgi:hypothetical protein
MIPSYVYHKPFKIQSDQQNWFSPEGLARYADRSKTNEGTGAGGINWAEIRGITSVLGSTP